MSAPSSILSRFAGEEAIALSPPGKGQKIHKCI